MSCPNRNSKGTWRQDVESLTSKAYFGSCQRAQDFSYQGFLLWSKNHLIGRAKVRQEWSDARKHLHKSQHQTLREAAVRLDKAWASGVDETFETTFFKEQQAKRQLMNGRLTVHAAADNVIVKRQRIELEEEERFLDEGLQSDKYDFPAERLSSDFGQGDDLMAGQMTPPKRVQGHSDIVPLVTDLTASFRQDMNSINAFSLSHEDQGLYNTASEWFRTVVGRDLETTIKTVRKDQFREPWVHDLLYERLKLLRTGLGPQCDENTYTSFWIVPDFVALQTGIPSLISAGFANENHFGPSAWRRALSRGKPYAKGTNVDAYYLGRDDFVDIIFENVGSPLCTDHSKHTEDKEKSYRNAADALLERFYNSTGSFEIAKGYCVIIAIVFGHSVPIYTVSIREANVFAVSRVFQGKYHFSKDVYLANILVHLKFCLTIKTIMERNVDVSCKFGSSIESLPVEEQAHFNLSLHSTPVKEKIRRQASSCRE